MHFKVAPMKSALNEMYNRYFFITVHFPDVMSLKKSIKKYIYIYLVICTETILKIKASHEQR